MRFERLVFAMMNAIAMTLSSAMAQDDTHRWRSIGGDIKDAPVLVAGWIAGQRMLFVAARGKDDALHWTMRDESGRWSDWRSAGGSLTSAPACIARARGIVECFMRGKYGFPLQRTFTNGVWSSWRAPGRWSRRIEGAPVVYSAGPGSMSLLARRTGRIRVTSWYPLWDSWDSSWTPLPMKATTETVFDCDAVLAPLRGLPANATGEERFRKYGGERRGRTVCMFRHAGDGALAYLALLSDAGEGQRWFEHELRNTPATNFAPDIRLRPQKDRTIVVVSVTATDGTLRRASFQLAGRQPGDIPTSELSWADQGGQLTSAPSCMLTTCAARGRDGAVWVWSQRAQ